MARTQKQADVLAGNNYHEKYKMPAERKRVYKAFCDHVASGLSMTCFPECSEPTMRLMMSKYPNELCPTMLEEAKRKAVAKLERIGIDASMGEIKNHASNTWKMIMMNKAGWTQKHSIETDNIEQRDALLAKLESKIDQRLKKENKKGDA